MMNGHLSQEVVERRHRLITAEKTSDALAKFSLNFRNEKIGHSLIINADCLDWLKIIPQASLHAIVTDPPYGIKEYETEQILKRENGKGGTWRIPPTFDGCTRAPLPRFTALNRKERQIIYDFFYEWSRLISQALLPGGHVFIACNAFLSQIVFSSIIKGGLDFRGEIIRVVRTLRGGDRPKNAEEEYPFVSSLARGCYEPWGLFRNPLPQGMKVSECLRKYQTGGLRRFPDGRPFCDVIYSERTPKKEKDIANHPSLKPQSFMRQVTYASLPVGKGIIADTFMGSGSTIAAAEAQGLTAVGIERQTNYYCESRKSIPILSRIHVENDQSDQLSLMSEDR